MKDRSFNIIGGPGSAGFEGVMNPCIFAHSGSAFAIAKGIRCHWKDARDEMAPLFVKGAPLLIPFDEKLSPRAPIELSVGGRIPASEWFGIEDFRAFPYDGRILVGHPLLWIEEQAHFRNSYRATQLLSELDTEKGELRAIGTPELDFPLRTFEKNWCYFEHEGNLHLLYSFSPFRLLRKTEKNGFHFRTIEQRRFEHPPGGMDDYPSEISLSAGPIQFDDDHLFFVIHRHRLEGRPNEAGRGRHYAHWGVLLDRRTLLPVKITREPIFVGGRARGPMPGIIYVMGMIREGNDIVFSVGEGDDHASLTRMPIRSLNDLWIDLPALRSMGVFGTAPFRAFDRFLARRQSATLSAMLEKQA